MKKAGEYINPKSLTFWVGIISIAVGAITNNQEMISIGLGWIGIRAAVQKILNK